MAKDLFGKMTDSIINGDVTEAKVLAEQSLEEGINPMDAINKGFVVGVDYVGEKFSNGDLFLPELVIAGEAMKSALSVLEPELSRLGTERTVLGKVILATVEGDIHDIGKTLVGTMLSSNGFKVYDLGVDVPTETIINTARDVDADIIALSALLTTTMVTQKTVKERVSESDLGTKVKIMVGGAPVTSQWVEEIGVDGYSEDAIGAVKVAKELVS